MLPVLAQNILLMCAVRYSPCAPSNSELFFMPAKGAQMDVRNENFFKGAVFVFFADIVLFKRIAVTLCIVTLLVAFLVPPTYDIGGRILVESKQISLSPDSLGAPTGFSQVLPSTPQDVETEVSLILSPQFFKFAALRMRELNILPASQFSLLSWVQGAIGAVMDYAKQGITSLTGYTFPPPDDLLWKDLMNSVDAEIMPGTNLVQLYYYSRSPAEDLLPAKLFMESFLLFRQNQGTATESSFYAAKLAEYEKQYTQLERRKADLLNEMKLSGDVNQEIARLTTRVNDTEEELMGLKEKRDIAKIWLTYIQHTAKELEKQKNELRIMPPFPFNFESSDIKEINMRLFDLILEYIRISSTFTEEFDQAKGARQNLRSLERYILKMCENEIVLRNTNLKILEYQIAEKEELRANSLKKLQYLKNVAPELFIITAQASSLQNVIQTFIRRSEESRLQAEAGNMLQMTNVRIAVGPSVPERPYFPRKRIVIPVGFAGAILMALLVVFTRHMLGRNFVTPSDVRKILGLPTLASIKQANYIPPDLSVLWRLDDVFPKTMGWVSKTFIYKMIARRLTKKQPQKKDIFKRW
jgi:uncharacterized protein involved in exopolysaccharide biosynthesis